MRTAVTVAAGQRLVRGHEFGGRIAAMGASAVRQAVDLVASSGTVVVVRLSQDEVSLPLLEFTGKELTVAGSRNNAGRFPAAVDLVRRKPELVARLVTHRSHSIGSPMRWIWPFASRAMWGRS